MSGRQTAFACLKPASQPTRRLVLQLGRNIPNFVRTVDPVGPVVRKGRQTRRRLGEHVCFRVMSWVAQGLVLLD